MAEEEVLTLKVETKGAKEAAKEMTAVEKATDKFIKSLSIEDRAELQIAIQDYNSLGE